MSVRAQAPMRISVCMYEYVYAYMNVRMMRAYERAGAHAPVCMYVCIFPYMHACVCVPLRLCVCIYICPILFSYL